MVNKPAKKDTKAVHQLSAVIEQIDEAQKQWLLANVANDIKLTNFIQEHLGKKSKKQQVSLDPIQVEHLKALIKKLNTAQS